MKFLPFENISFKTKLSQEEVKNRLIKNMSGWGKDFGRTFEGEFKGNEFEMKRIIYYRNSFLPIINGTITNEFSGTTVNVKFRLNNFALIFGSIFSGLSLIFFIFSLMAARFSGHFTIQMLFPLGLIIWIYLLTMVFFKFECRKAKKELAKIIEGEIVE